MLETLSQFFAQWPGGELVWTVLVFVVVFGVLVFFHELGHYWAARSVGIKVEAFAIGFGREICGWYDRHGTRWKLCWIPLGGYVQMHGFQADEAQPLPAADPQAFAHKPVWARMWVVAAGPLANYALAIVCFFALLWAGQRVLAPEIGGVQAGQPAAAAGLVVGDRVLAVQAITTWEQLQEQVVASAGAPLTLLVQRQDQQLELTVTPRVQTVDTLLGDTVTRPMLGVSPGTATVAIPHSFTEAWVGAVDKTVDLTLLILTAVGKMLTGQMGGENVGGPILIAQQAAQSADQGWYPLIFFVALMSVNLGLLNLFPIPVLDGGHLVLLGYEGVRGKPLSYKVQEWGFKLGGGLLIGLMIFAFYNDIVRLITG